MNDLSQSSTLMRASNEWLSRPPDERFVDLPSMLDKCLSDRTRSTAQVVSSRKIEARPVEGDRKALVIMDPDGRALAPTHHAFGQICARADAPATYLRKLPTDLVADNLNYGFAARNVEEVGILSRKELPAHILACATGPNYGRVWNDDVIEAVINRFGDGVTGDFRVPGEFGEKVHITKENTTLFRGDRDMFIFLADEEHRIEIPNRRRGQSGSLARGFFLWNSEVGAATLGIGTFLFDYVCCNRIVWGANGYEEIRIRHTSGAPDRFIEEVTPALLTYAKSETVSITESIAKAQAAKIEDEVTDFLTNRRFSRNQAQAINLAHLSEEGRPIETIWDAVTGVTAYAKGIANQDDRVAVERMGGKLLDLAA